MAQAKEIKDINKAYDYCKYIVKSNYENFPVASFFLPKYLRAPISAIYAFARLADNYVDNDKLKPTEKLIALNYLETLLENMAKPTEPTNNINDNYINTQEEQSEHIKAAIELFNNGVVQAPEKEIILALTHAINMHDLPTLPFLDLLTAFKQDISQNRYYDFGEVLNYCCYSANPIGRLMLHLTKQDNIENLEYSDYICTSLQLINFMQDLHYDLTILDRCYIPLTELNKFNVTIEELKNKEESINIEKLIKYQLDRIHAIYNKGMNLGSQLNGLFGYEIRLIIAGGHKILQKLYNRKKYYKKPKLSLTNKIKMSLIALSPNLFSKEQLIMVNENG